MLRETGALRVGCFHNPTGSIVMELGMLGADARSSPYCPQSLLSALSNARMRIYTLVPKEFVMQSCPASLPPQLNG